jgi:hypothetical protein
LQLLGCNSTVADIRQRMLIATSSAMARGPEVLKALLASHESSTKFASRLAANLVWLRAHAHCFTAWPDPTVDHRPWHDIMRNNPGVWATAVKTVIDRTVDCKIEKPMFIDLESTIPPPIDAHFCTLCPPSKARHCTSAAGLRQHQLVAHGVKCPIRPFVVTSKCPACSLEYNTRFRALRHARYDSAKCRARILEGHCPLPAPELLAQADADDRLVVALARKAGTTPGKATIPGPKSGPKKVPLP